MHTVYLSLGSNQGDRKSILLNAIQSISEEIGNVIAISAIYESEPLGFISEDCFLNMCICIQTDLDPISVLKKIHSIEKKEGRVRNDAKGYVSRTLDIDVIFYDDLILKTKEIQIPHPLYKERLFVLVPLAEIAKKIIDPQSLTTIDELISTCSDKSMLIKQH